jgi:hypothetical protein
MFNCHSLDIALTDVGLINNENSDEDEDEDEDDEG